jgi:hypothetical protein
LRRVISVHILCLDDCLDTTIMPQPTEITQFIFGQPLREPELSPVVSAPQISTLAELIMAAFAIPTVEARPRTADARRRRFIGFPYFGTISVLGIRPVGRQPRNLEANAVPIALALRFQGVTAATQMHIQMSVKNSDKAMPRRPAVLREIPRQRRTSAEPAVA